MISSGPEQLQYKYALFTYANNFFSALLLCFVSKEEEGPYFKSRHQLLVIISQGAVFWIKIDDFSMSLSADTLQPPLSFSSLSLSPFLHGIIKEKKKPELLQN